MSEIIKNRYEFTILFDVENGNPNGDPDAANMPRVDPETGLGLVTDVCLKRKIRNYVEDVKEGRDGYRIYIQDGVTLNSNDLKAGNANNIGAEILEIQQAKDKKEAKAVGGKLKKQDPLIDIKLRDWMCENFFDVRTFGAVMTTFVKGSLNCGQVRGPVQLTFGKSIEPIITQSVTLTRVAITTASDALKKDNEMANKHIVPYALYRADGFISANLARKVTHFTEEDLELLWEAIINMFENDHSAARGKMAVRKLIIFKHDSELGNAPSHKTLDLVSIKRRDGVDIARNYNDYDVIIDEERCPEGVTISCRE